MSQVNLKNSQIGPCGLNYVSWKIHKFIYIYIKAVANNVILELHLLRHFKA